MWFQRTALAIATLVLVACFPEAPGAADGGKLVRAQVPVAGEYIVVLAEAPDARPMSTAEVVALSEELLAPLQKKPGQELAAALRAFTAAGLTEQEALSLAKDERVAYVEENGVIAVTATQSAAPWGLDRIDQASLPLNQAYRYNTDGAGVRVYVIDTGVRATHAGFGGRVTAGFSAVDDGQGAGDCHGHGTAVAGIIGSATWGVAKNAQMVSVRVLDCQGHGTTASVLAGVDWVAARRGGPSVANLSLGGGASDALDAAVRNLVAAGVTTVVAAGNGAQDACTVSPAREGSAITVAATTPSDAFASFSNLGSCVDLAAPGVDIPSAGSTSDSASELRSGTSMASPHVAGAAALYLASNPSASPAQVLAVLAANATAGRLTGVGGAPNLLLYTGFIGGGGGNAAPAVTFTAPTAGATVSGMVTLAATASDVDGAVVAVRFELPDGTAVTDTSAPYSATWNTAQMANGVRAVRAIATDDGGATSSAQIMVTVANGSGSCIDGTFRAIDVPKAIPDNDLTGVTSTVTVTGDGVVASLALSLDISHPYRGDLVVTLSSPRGTSYSVTSRAGGSADNLVLLNVPVTAFAGEPAAGAWKLVASDHALLDAGTLNSWSLRIVGSCAVGGAAWSGSATPNLATVDDDQVCSTLRVSSAGGLAAAAKLDVTGRHDYRSSLRATLSHGGATVTAFATGTFADEAGAFSLAGRPIAGLSGDAAGDWTLCLVDTDAFGDTGVLSTWAVHD